MTKFAYQETPLEKRKADISALIAKHPNRIPVYVQSNTPDIVIVKNKLLICKDHTVGQVLYTIRSKLKMSSDKAIFLLDESGHLPMTSQLIDEIYRTKKNIDGCLYLTVAIESTFG